MNRNNPILYIVIPCYNEEQVLPYTNPMFVEKIEQLVKKEEIHPHSKIMYVNDGSKDRTWELIESYANSIPSVVGVSQSRNRGHQSSVLAGMYEAIQFADIVITTDADGQDDINCMDKMISEYKSGSEIVYGVRDNRDTDSAFKRITAEGFYKVLRLFGAEVVFNHADYRLVSKRFLKELEKFTEVNLFLCGLMPLVGFKYSYVSYKRHERIAGESHYPLSKMLGLAMDGITSLSIKPIRLITSLGVLTSLFSFLLIIWVLLSKFVGTVVTGWASTYAIVSLLGGVQLISLGVIGEYIGKIYLETKRRPRYIISERTFDKDRIL
ncbi:TPA: glycosyltransferase family 2 protein [Streptococcus pneumoniae]|nr:putative glycosyltransferase [Streptococcus pneumoniae]VNB24209.1 putative glycosyltransferase [Streptococcus pneumoniae]HEV6207304.1 glycosyltransferase family 2 protein [Streptococcus pneumoniae]HEV6501889.1 glycosyltransferase family 2 protein [Streptococcus pneumoniae]